MSDEPRGTARYRRSDGLAGLSPEGREYAAQQYRKAREPLDEFDKRYRLKVHHGIPCPLYPRVRLLNFGRHVYGLKRRLAGEALLERVAGDALVWVSDWTGPDRLARAARLALDVIDGTGTDADEHRIKTRIESLLLEQEAADGEATGSGHR